MRFKDDTTPDHDLESRHAAVLRRAPDACICMDAAGVVLEWNEAAETLFGWTATDAVGRELVALVAPRHLQGLLRAALRELTTEPASRLMDRTLELRGVRRGGAEVLVEVDLRALEADGASVAYVRDVRAERALRAAVDSELRLAHAALDLAGGALAGCDEAGELVLCNAAARELLGPVDGHAWRAADGLLDLDGPLAADAHPLARALRGEDVTGQIVVVRREGAPERTLVCSGGPVADADGRLAGAVVTLVDHRGGDEHRPSEIAALAALTRTSHPDETLAFLAEAVVGCTGAVAAHIWRMGEDGRLVLTDTDGHAPPDPAAAQAAWDHGAAVPGQRTLAETVHGTDGVHAVLVATWASGVPADDAALARVLAEQAAAAIVRAELLDDLERLARTDGLTGLPNRRAWDAAVARAMALRRRHGTSFCVAVLDLDFFKKYNDTYGHVAGDRLLQEAARTWAAELRPSDVIARWGGEEFSLLLTHTDAAGALEVVERLRGLTPHPCTCSAGLVAATGGDAEVLLQRADEALYLAKNAGRDRTVVWGDAPVPPRPVASVELEPAIRALTSALQARDGVTAAHCSAVGALAGAVARAIGLPPEIVAETERVAVLHDLGKLSVPDSILHKPGPLEPSEWEVLRDHPAAGGRLVASVPGLERLARAIELGQERWDGAGYPHGLAGEDIPLPSRIAAVCDAFDAMTSDRPYRPAMPRDEALSEIERLAGRQFDPRVAEALIAVAA